jgi:hypothetical protein
MQPHMGHVAVRGLGLDRRYRFGFGGDWLRRLRGIARQALRPQPLRLFPNGLLLRLIFGHRLAAFLLLLFLKQCACAGLFVIGAHCHFVVPILRFRR